MKKRKTPISNSGARPYEVGYCRPPKAGRFKPGQSGNPRGRKRGVRNFNTILRSILEEKIVVRQGDATRRISKYEAIAQGLVTKAIRGDVKAIKVIYDHTHADPYFVDPGYTTAIEVSFVTPKTRSPRLEESGQPKGRKHKDGG